MKLSVRMKGERGKNDRRTERKGRRWRERQTEILRDREKVRMERGKCVCE